MCRFKDELRIARLDDNISYIQPTVNPLSANVVIINSKDAVWLYDVGKHTHIGSIIEDDVYIEDGKSVLHMFPLPSSHAKGSIALEVNDEYCFLGDGLYAMQKGFQSLYNTGILKEEIEVLKKVKAKNFMCSHKTPFGRSKAGVIRWLESIYNMKTKDNPYILYE